LGSKYYKIPLWTELCQGSRYRELQHPRSPRDPDPLLDLAGTQQQGRNRGAEKEEEMREKK